MTLFSIKNSSLRNRTRRISVGAPNAWRRGIARGSLAAHTTPLICAAPMLCTGSNLQPPFPFPACTPPLHPPPSRAAQPRSPRTFFFCPRRPPLRSTAPASCPPPRRIPSATTRPPALLDRSMPSYAIRPTLDAPHHATRPLHCHPAAAPNFLPPLARALIACAMTLLVAGRDTSMQQTLRRSHRTIRSHHLPRHRPNILSASLFSANLPRSPLLPPHQIWPRNARTREERTSARRA